MHICIINHYKRLKGDRIMSYSEPSYSYSSNENGDTGDYRTTSYDSYYHTTGHVYQNGHELYVDSYTDKTYGKTETETYDYYSGTTTYYSSDNSSSK